MAGVQALGTRRVTAAAPSVADELRTYLGDLGNFVDLTSTTNQPSHRRLSPRPHRSPPRSHTRSPRDVGAEPRTDSHVDVTEQCASTEELMEQIRGAQRRLARWEKKRKSPRQMPN
mmetsp:Transcript_28358/g.67130  ORF Transcript_28358/g.67130 Transcript_28358/m.67130 type:complete len:116 (+) Transcript_28358:731-1078(+)